MSASAEEHKLYYTVLTKFNTFFKVQKNEWARFNWRSQQGETAEEYIVALYDFAEICDYGARKEGMIRDHLVGIRDRALSQKL